MFVRTSAKQIDLALRPQGNEKKEEYSARYEQSSNHRDNLRNIVLELGECREDPVGPRALVGDASSDSGCGALVPPINPIGGRSVVLLEKF